MEQRQKRADDDPMVGGGGRPRGRPKTASDAAKRQFILKEAQTTFEEMGYGGTTMDLVAARCKISKQTLYKHFSRKLDLFVAVMNAHRETMLALPRDPDETLSLADALADIFMIDIDEEAEHARRGFLQAIMLDVQAFPEISRAVHEHGVEQSRLMLTEWLSARRAEGRIVLDDTRSGARMLMDMMFGAMVGPPGHINDWPDRKTRRAHLRRCIDVFLHGVCRAKEE